MDLQQPASATIRTSHTDNQMKQIIKVHMPEADREEIWLHIGIQHVKKLPWSNACSIWSILEFSFDDTCMWFWEAAPINTLQV